MSGPVTKLQRVLDALRANDAATALRIAARFPRLGSHGEYKRSIVTAHEALVHPRFYRDLGKDPDVLVAAGVRALHDLFGHLIERK